MFTLEAFENSLYQIEDWSSATVPRGKAEELEAADTAFPEPSGSANSGELVVYDNWVFEQPYMCEYNATPAEGFRRSPPHAPGGADLCTVRKAGAKTSLSRRKRNISRRGTPSSSSSSSASWPDSSTNRNSLSRFTLQDENGKRRIRHDIMSIAESLPALPGLYFDKKQKGFRVRYQNVYVGWVALSRFPSIEEAYCSARDIWENAKAHAEKFQTPQAAIIASLPLQKQAKASGKNRGGRPRTVTQLPAEWGPNRYASGGETSPPDQWYANGTADSLALAYSQPKYGDFSSMMNTACPDDLVVAQNPALAAPAKLEDDPYNYGTFGVFGAPSPISYGKPVDEFGFDTTPWSLKKSIEN